MSLVLASGRMRGNSSGRQEELSKQRAFPKGCRSVSRWCELRRNACDLTEAGVGGGGVGSWCGGVSGNSKRESASGSGCLLYMVGSSNSKL